MPSCAPAGFSVELLDRLLQRLVESPVLCRAIAYLGPPVRLSDLLHAPDNSLVAQSYDPQYLHMLNLAGFGLVSWSGESPLDEPLTYKSTQVPVYDSNLASLARHVKGQCVVAHVRGIAYRTDSGFGAENLHPFRYAGAPVALAHNGDLSGFARMRLPLIERIDPEVAVALRGSTDSEWIYALLLTHLKRQQAAGADAVVRAIEASIRELAELRKQLGIDTSSSLNLFVAGPGFVVALRYTFDFGRYPLDVSRVHPANSSYLSLWYTVGSHFAPDEQGRYRMAAGDGPPGAVLVASEPLTLDPSGWVEVPEYSVLVAEQRPSGRRLETLSMDI